MKINNLRDCERLMTVMIRRKASIGAVVEFSARASTGFARD
ncbi:hypothetical protein [Piscinibacter terrae]|nr:hypothetical protein [Albitalea terrae]